MKFLVFFAALVAVCVGQNYNRNPYNNYPGYNNQQYYKQGLERNANTIRSNFDLSPEGTYQYDYQTDNGIAAEQSGYPRPIGGNEIAETVQGRFSWTSPEGQVVSIGYVADENGYRPVGDAIPTPPPVPLAILRSIEYNRLKAAQPQRKFY